MSTLTERIHADLTEAMRNREETRKSALRMLTAALKNAEIDAREPLADEAAEAVVQKQAKQRRESILEFRKANRDDLVQKEEAELVVLEAYMPKQVDRSEVEAAAHKLISESGASGPRDIGKVMPPLVKQFAGRADGRMINEVVRELLGA